MLIEKIAKLILGKIVVEGVNKIGKQKFYTDATKYKSNKT